MNRLDKLIHQHYELSELETLSLALDIVWEDLPRRNTRLEAVRWLIADCYKNKNIVALLNELEKGRPFVDWPTAAAVIKDIEKNSHYYRHGVPTTPTDPLRQNFINKTRQAWIDGLLKNAVHKEIELTLNKRYDREAVSSFNARLLQDSDEPIPPDTTILDIYEKSGGSLLILGAPASGKTILLLQLAEQLLNQAETADHLSVPAILNLSSWASKQLPLAEWIAEELFTQQQTARTLSQRWLQENKLILFLDGLDEVAEAVRDDCVAAINDFQADYPASLVVCSRLEDYATLPSQLNLATAIRLWPLTASQVDDYLAQFGEPLAPLRQTVHRDGDLAELAQSPLMVSLMALAYDEETPQPDPSTSLADKQQHLFATYQERVFTHRPLAAKVGYDQAQATHWLTNLAHGLTQHSLSIFYIEQLQPTWLPQRQLLRWPYRLIASLIGGVSFGLVDGLTTGLILGLIGSLIGNLTSFLLNGVFGGLVGGLIFGLILGSIFGLSEKWFFAQLGRLSKSRSWYRIIIDWLIIGLIVRLSFGLIDVLSFGSFDNLFNALIGRLIGGLIGGLVVGLIDIWLQGKLSNGAARWTANTYQYLLQQYQQKGIEVVKDISWKRPELKVWWLGAKRGLKNGLRFGLITGIIIGLIIGILIGLRFGLNDGLTGGLFFGLFFGFLGGLIGGSLGGLIGGLQTAVLQHQMTRSTEPNEGIRATKRTLIRAGFPFTLIGAVVGVGAGTLIPPIFALLGSLEISAWNWPILGLAVGLVGPFSYGGVTLWRHYVLRWRLTRQGVLPFGISDRKLIAYLDDMVDHLLLRRVGGGWVFIHRTLQEYFAAQHPQAGQPLPPPPPIPKID